MIKKALLTLMATAVLVTSVPATTARAAGSKYIDADDCVYLEDLQKKGKILESVSVSECCQILKETGTDNYYLAIFEYSDEDGMMLYPLNGSVVLKTDDNEITVKYDGSSYSVSMTNDAEEERKHNEKIISKLAVCKHPSAGNVTLSASEKKGTLVVTKADIKTATKLDKILKSGVATTVKIKASSQSKAVSQFKSLRKLTGHANTYGVLPWIQSNDGIPYTEKINSSVFKKSGSYYTVKISKSIAKNYTYICKGYENLFNGEEAKSSGYNFNKGTHLCDCSDLSKAAAVGELEARHYNNGGFMNRNDKNDFKRLTGAEYDMCFRYACGGLARVSQKIGYASGIKSEYIIADEPDPDRDDHAFASYTVKDSSNKTVIVAVDNAGFISVTDGGYDDTNAIFAIIGGKITGRATGYSVTYLLDMRK